MAAVAQARAAPIRHVSALAAAVLMLGMAEAITGPYLVLYCSTRAGMSPLRIGALTTVAALFGILASIALGRRYDRRPGRRHAVVALVAPAAGYVIFTLTTAYGVLLAVAAPLVGLGAAAFPQLFALARGYLGGRERAADRAMPALRSVWSLAWTLGPLAGAALLAKGGFIPLLLCTAASFLLVGGALAALGALPGGAPAAAGAAEPPPPTRSLVPAVVAFGLFYTAVYAGSIVLPLYVTRTLGRPSGDVGVLFSVCAAVEIPAALALIPLPARVRTTPLIAGAVVLLAVFLGMTAAGHGTGVLITAQAARGISIAVVSALGIVYFQRQLPGAPGRATTLFANTSAGGSLVSGLFAGAAAQWLGYRPALVACGAVALAAAALLLLPRNPQARRAA